MFFIGFDVGGTKIEAMLIHFGDTDQKQNSVLQFEYQKLNHEIVKGYVLHKKRTPTERHHGYEQIIEKMGKLIEDVCREKNIHPKDLSGVGLSVPGPVHPQTGVMGYSNTMILAHHNVHEDLKSHIKLDCQFKSENDANCFALAEVYCGAGIAHFKKTGLPVHQQTGIGLILGSGFGGGLVTNGGILRGKRGGGGEIGHTTLYHDGHPCYCGRRGCAEQYLCGPALEAALSSRMYSQIEKRLKAPEIFELYNTKDPIALAIVKQYKKDLASFLGSLTCILDPDYYVLGGGLSLQDILYVNLEENIGKNTYLPDEPVSVYKHQIGDSAGAIGAALIARDKI
jgi:fructokinase